MLINQLYFRVKFFATDDWAYLSAQYLWAYDGITIDKFGKPNVKLERNSGRKKVFEKALEEVAVIYEEEQLNLNVWPSANPAVNKKYAKVKNPMYQSSIQ